MRNLDTELLSLGVLTSLFLAALAKQPAAGLATASFYLLTQFIPYLPWTARLDEDVFSKYVVINALGFFFNPMVYYFLNLFGVPIALSTIALISLITFISGTIFVLL